VTSLFSKVLTNVFVKHCFSIVYILYNIEVSLHLFSSKNFSLASLLNCGAMVGGLAITGCSYPKVAIFKHFTVNQAETLMEAQSLI
jgi:hypothetical protein